MIDKIQLINPFVVAGGFFLLFLLIYLAHAGINLISGIPMEDSDIWVFAYGGRMIYSTFGPIHVLLASNTNHYYNQPIMAFLGLLVLSVLGASLVSGKDVFNLAIQRKGRIFEVFDFF